MLVVTGMKLQGLLEEHADGKREKWEQSVEMEKTVQGTDERETQLCCHTLLTAPPSPPSVQTLTLNQ